MARIGGWLVGMGMDEMAGKQGDDCKKAKKKKEKKTKKHTLVTWPASFPSPMVSSLGLLT